MKINVFSKTRIKSISIGCLRLRHQVSCIGNNRTNLHEKDRNTKMGESEYKLNEMAIAVKQAIVSDSCSCPPRAEQIPFVHVQMANGDRSGTEAFICNLERFHGTFYLEMSFIAS